MRLGEIEDYSEAAAHYDLTRRPVGVEWIRAAMDSLISTRIGKLRVLDLGCGSGNYFRLLDSNSFDVTGLDQNREMLRRAADKPTSTHLVQGSGLRPPLRRAIHDLVVCNHVLHHVAGGPPEWSDLQRFLNCIFELLRPGGLACLNITTPIQQRDGYWWSPLIQDAVDRVGKRMPATDVVTSMLDRCGFEGIRSEIPLNEILQPEGYLDPMGPFSETFRRGDSTWAMASAKELQDGLDLLEALIAGGLEDFLEGRETLRLRTGQTTVVLATRPY